MMDEALAGLARDVLRQNSAGGWTKPSPAQYPHQWNWDSAFIGLGWSTFDWPRACQEIESLLAGRWRDGMIPHLRYDPARLADYFPGPDWWPHAADHTAEPGVLTSGISNPPVAVITALEVGRRAPSPEAAAAFWRRTYGPLRDYVLWFRRSRTLAGSALPVTVHPWESGWDNSPRWDFLRAARLKPSRPYRRLDTRHVSHAQRPADRDYDAFLALVELLDACDYDVDRYHERSPFCVHDVALDGLWFGAALAINEIGTAIGEPPAVSEAELERYRGEFESVHWDEEQEAYVDLDLVTGRRIQVPTAAGLAAAAGGGADPERCRRMWRRYRERCEGLYQVPTAAPGGWFEPRRYWRGPVWINVNWLVARGLELAGLEADAERLRHETLELAAAGDLPEYLEPATGEPLGASRFSWTAALVLDLLQRRGKPAV